MNDHDAKKPTLSEISHLFLSSVRDLQTNGSARPLRTPPGRATPPEPDVSVDMTPEEFAQIYGDLGDGPDDAGDAAPADLPAAPAPRRQPPVTAVLGAHLNGSQSARVREYARHLAGHVGRIGLIELDAAEFRLTCFEPGGDAHRGIGGADPGAGPAECHDSRRIAEAIEELNWDVEHWLLLAPNLRAPEARPLLRAVGRWVLLSTCDHDGVVSSYRTLKSLSDETARPRLSLALLDGPSEPEMNRVHGKLAGVCTQFLGRELEREPAVRAAGPVAEHLVMYCRPGREKAQLANPPQWQIVADFLARAADAAAATPNLGPGNEAAGLAPTGGESGGSSSDRVPDAAPAHAPFAVCRNENERVPTVPAPAAAEEKPVSNEAEATATSVTNPTNALNASDLVAAASPASAAPAVATSPSPSDAFAEVLDLPGVDGSAESILSAVVRQAGGAYVECPVRPPMCPDARLAVGRDRELTLLAVARAGLADLRAIGQAYRWLSENRGLIGMAVPQLAIDAHQLPRLRLLVDQSDVTADLLQPMLGSGHVTVLAYRKLRWGGKTGLLLEAA